MLINQRRRRCRGLILAAFLADAFTSLLFLRLPFLAMEPLVTGPAGVNVAVSADFSAATDSDGVPSPTSEVSAPTSTESSTEAMTTSDPSRASAS